MTTIQIVIACATGLVGICLAVFKAGSHWGSRAVKDTHQDAALIELRGLVKALREDMERHLERRDANIMRLNQETAMLMQDRATGRRDVNQYRLPTNTGGGSDV